MLIELTGISEKLIQAGLISGEFQTAEEMITVMARAWLASPSGSVRELSRFGFQFSEVLTQVSEEIVPAS